MRWISSSQLAERLLYPWRAAENLQIIPIGMADDRVLIIGIELDNPVIALEGPEEPNAASRLQKSVIQAKTPLLESSPA
jgi:hypothetical protein